MISYWRLKVPDYLRGFLRRSTDLLRCLQRQTPRGVRVRYPVSGVRSEIPDESAIRRRLGLFRPPSRGDSDWNSLRSPRQRALA